MQRRPYVAVVDDDDGMCRALRRLLHSSHMNVDTFHSGGEILRSLSHRPADCVVLDVELPDFKALDLFDRLRTAHPGVPLIIMTAWQDDSLREKALAAGAAGFFYKPFRDQDLLDAMQTAMAGAGQPPEPPAPAAGQDAGH